MKKSITKSVRQTQKLGHRFAKEILALGPGKSAAVLGLQGDLGAGKTTFLQGFARGLGLKDIVNSPTFVIMRRFTIYDLRFKNLYHIDCYRIHSAKEMLNLGFEEIIKNPKNIVAIEWPENIKKILPKSSILITFKHLDSTTRGLTIKKEKYMLQWQYGTAKKINHH